jgi:hypothetical protein
MTHYVYSSKCDNRKPTSNYVRNPERTGYLPLTYNQPQKENVEGVIYHRPRQHMYRSFFSYIGI